MVPRRLSDEVSGSPRVLADLHDDGEVLSRKPVAKAMRRLGLTLCRPLRTRRRLAPALSVWPCRTRWGFASQEVRNWLCLHDLTRHRPVVAQRGRWGPTAE